MDTLYSIVSLCIRVVCQPTKKIGKIAVGLFLLILVFRGSSVNAHLGGLPIARVNGVDTKLYTVRGILSIFNLPPEADAAPENYSVNQDLVFFVDVAKIVIPPKYIFDKADFIWDFGDGTPKETIRGGAQNKHRYKKIGTFVATVTVDYTSAGMNGVKPQVIQSTVVNILPNKRYKLPKAVITVNGEEVRGNGSSEFGINENVKLDGSKSRASSIIAKYEWDFGDGTYSHKKQNIHSYKTNDFRTIILRVTDANGFFSDHYVTLTIDDKPKISETSTSETNLMPMIVMAITILLCLLSYLYLKKKYST